MGIARRSLVIGAGAAAASGVLGRDAAAAGRAADLIVMGGTIVTMDEAAPTTEAVVVKDGRIVTLGGAHAMLEKWVGHRTRVIHLHGKTLLPGFIDTHGQFLNAARDSVGQPQPAEAEMLRALHPAQMMYAGKGVTTAQEGAASAHDLAFLRDAAAQHRLFIDVVALPSVTELPPIMRDRLQTGANGATAPAGDPALEFGHYKDHLKLGGIKFVLDGAPQAKMAFLTRKLLTPGPQGQKDWVGEPAMPKPLALDLYRRVTAHNIQVWSHASGDAAIDIAIAAAQGAGVEAGDDRRHVVVQSQIMRPDQLDSYAALGLTASFFVASTFFWGDELLADLGPERVGFLSPMKSAQAKGIALSNHNDFPATPVDPMRMIWSSAQRKTRSGAVLGPDQRVDVMTALKALTVVPAWQYREEASKGSIAVGKRADFVVLDRNPLAVPVDDILTIKVVETLKDGHTVYPPPGRKKA
jgi:predicted amidohydrolase YtcJ